MLTLRTRAKARARRGLDGDETGEERLAATVELGVSVPAASGLGGGNGRASELHGAMVKLLAAAARGGRGLSVVKLRRRRRERSEAAARGAGSEREWEGGHRQASGVYVAVARLWLAGGLEGERGCAAGRWTWPRRRPLAAGGW